MDTLVKLFGSSALVKIMRLFLFNPSVQYATDEIRLKTRVSASQVRWAINLLTDIGFLRSGTVTRMGARKNKKKVAVWSLNDTCPYVIPLHELLLHTQLMTPQEVERRLKGVGALKLVIISGIFIQDRDSRVDLLIVGDRIKNAVLTRAIGGLESALGTEIRYAVFDSKEFKYRLDIYDKLVRDILDYRHTKIINKLGL